MLSVLNQSQKLISVFRKKQSVVHETRSAVLQRPRKSFRRSPEKIIEVDKRLSPVKNTLANYKSTMERGRILKKSPSLLMSRRKLSPAKEVQRDDFIDTADMILGKEIEIIHKLTKIKEQRMKEIEEIKLITQEELRRVNRAKELQPKIIKKIQEEQEVDVYVHVVCNHSLIERSISKSIRLFI